LGLTIVAAPSLGHLYGWPLSAPLLSMIILAAGGALCLLFASRRWLFQRRDIVLIFLLIAPAGLIGLTVGGRNPATLLFLVFLPIWFAVVLVEKRAIWTWPSLTIITLCLVFAAVASALNGGIGSLLGARSYFTGFITPLIVVGLVNNRSKLRYVIRIFVVLGIINASVAVVQEARFLMNTDAALKTLSEENNPRTAEQLKTTPFGPMLRANGLYAHYRGMAHHVLLSLALIGSVYFSRKLRIAAVLVMIAGLLTTVSFGTYLNAVSTLLIFMYFRRPNYAVHYTCALLLAGTVVYASGGFQWLQQNVFSVIGENSGNDRIELLGIGLDALARHPLLGMGIRNVTRLSTFPEDWPVHNAFLHIASETGLLGGFFFALLIAMLFVRLATGIMAVKDERDRMLLKCLMVGFIAMVFDFLVEPFGNNLTSWIYISITASAVMVHSQRPLLSKGFGESV
jgi:hypothetical protein